MKNNNRKVRILTVWAVLLTFVSIGLTVSIRNNASTLSEKRDSLNNLDSYARSFISKNDVAMALNTEEGYQKAYQAALLLVSTNKVRSSNLMESLPKQIHSLEQYRDGLKKLKPEGVNKWAESEVVYLYDQIVVLENKDANLNFCLTLISILIALITLRIAWLSSIN